MRKSVEETRRAGIEPGGAGGGNGNVEWVFIPANKNNIYPLIKKAERLRGEMLDAGLDPPILKYKNINHAALDNLIWFMTFELSFHRKECESRRAEIGVVGRANLGERKDKK